jgi:hypothetical protein
LNGIKELTPMVGTRKLWAGRIGLLFLLTACQKTTPLPETALRAMAGADHLQLSTPAGTIAVIASKHRIARIAGFLDTYRKGWVRPPEPPRPELILRFYRDGNFLDTIGIGRGFIAAGEGFMRVQTLPEAQRKELMTLLRLEEREGLTPPDQPPVKEPETLVDPAESN